MNSDLKPLFASLKRLKIGVYISSEDFKLFSIEKDFDEEWEDCIKFEKRYKSFLSPNDYETAFGILMDDWFAEYNSTFDKWIIDVLLNFAKWNSFKLDFSNIIVNFNELNFSKRGVSKFINESKKIESTKLMVAKSTIEKIELVEKKAQTLTNKVFIVHGHDEKSRLELCNILKEELHLDPVVLLEKPNNSIETIISKFERLAEDCSYAIILLTPDDIVGENKRARQNVVFELGYFLGKFQPNNNRKIIILKKVGVEIPSDISGVLYLEYSKDVKEIYLDLKRQFQHWNHKI